MLDAHEVSEVAALLEELAVNQPDPRLSRSATRMAARLRARRANGAAPQGTQGDRFVAAAERDRAAAERDRAAEERDAQAQQRDKDAVQLDRAADAGARKLHRLLLAAMRRDGAGARTDRGSHGAEPDVMALREQAELDRELASTDRDQFRAALYEAQTGRRTALEDRSAAGQDRRAARGDRRMAQADRGAAAGDRRNGWTGLP
jgi:hypothetical protein